MKHTTHRRGTSLPKRIKRCGSGLLVGALAATLVLGSYAPLKASAAETTMEFSGIDTTLASRPALPTGNNFKNMKSKFVHDAEIIYGKGSDGKDRYYCFHTDQTGANAGNSGIPIRVSDDLVNWETVGLVFNSTENNYPSWLNVSSTQVKYTFTVEGDGVDPNFKGNRNTDANQCFWAPCIYDDTENTGYYYLYYSVSAYGTRNSNIGVARTKTLDTGWEDCGIIMKSRAGDDYGYNAIDALVLKDKEGKLWMTYGSFFRGTSIVELDPSDPTKTLKENDHGKTIAGRDDYDNFPYESDGFEGNYTTSTNGDQFVAYGLEGPTIIYSEETGYYYLCTTYDRLSYTYNTRIGRSKNIDGPYVDYQGNDLVGIQPQDGSGSFGTKLIAPYSFDNDALSGWVGTGHCSMFRDKDGNYFMAHNARPGNNQGTSWLNVRRMLFTEEGFAVVSPEWYAGEDVNEAKNVTAQNVYQDIEGQEASWEFLTMRSDNVANYTQYHSKTYQLTQNQEVINEHSTSVGSWNLVNDNMTIDFGEFTAKGKLFLGWDWENWKQTVLFSGISDKGETVWGKQVAFREPNDLLVKLDFDGEVKDSSGNEVGLAADSGYNSGELTYEEGLNGQAVRVPKMTTGDSRKSIIRLQNNIIKDGNDFTVSMWVKPDSLTGTPVSFFTEGSNTWGCIMPYHADSEQVYYDTPSFRISNDGTVRDYNTKRFYDTTAKNQLPLGQWTMVTISYDNGRAKMYTNGKLDMESFEKYPTNLITPINSSKQTYYIGGNTWDGTFDGLMDEFAIYESALSDSEVADLYREQAGISLDSIKISTSAQKTTYEIGESLNTDGLSVSAVYSNGETEEIKDYVLTGFDSTSAGKKTVTVTYRGKTTTFEVTVNEAKKEEPKGDTNEETKITIALSKTKATLYTKGSTTLTAKVTGGDAKKVVWKTSNASVASVSNGKVIAKKKGSANITATLNGVSAVCKVTVKKPSLKLKKSTITLKKGKKTTIDYTLIPKGKVTFKLVKKGVVTVSKKGQIKAKKKGKAVIKVTGYGITKKLNVKVK